jgi:hypothetical protein
LGITVRCNCLLADSTLVRMRKRMGTEGTVSQVDQRALFTTAPCAWSARRATIFLEKVLNNALFSGPKRDHTPVHHQLRI